MAAIASIKLSSLQANARTGPGTSFANVTVVLNPISQPFSGSLSVTGPDAAKFVIVTNPDQTSNLVVVPAQLPVGQYNIGIIATQAGLTNSPFTQNFVIRSVDPTQHQDSPPIPFPRTDAPIVNDQKQLIEPWVRFMTNIWSQTNGSSFLFNTNFPTPAVPAPGQAAIYLDPTDGQLKAVFSSGNIVDLGGPDVAKTAPIFNVLHYGAKGDGTTNDTAAVNAALTAAGAGGTVYFPATGHAYLIATGLIVPNNVNLLGDSGFEWSGANFPFPSTNWTKGGSWIQFTDMINPGITIQNGSRVSRLNFGYVQPIPSNTPGTPWTPTVYPYTIQITGNFNGLEDITILNASHGVDWEYGSTSGGGTYCYMRDCFITGFYKCMRIKNANDTMYFTNIHHRNLFYVSNSNVVDWQEGSPGQIGWDVEYLDNPVVNGVEFFQQAIAMNLADSTVQSLTHALVLGQFTNISFNLCVQAINLATGATTFTGMFANVIVQSDTSTARAASFFFNLASNNVSVLFDNLYVPYVGNGLFAVGAGAGGKIQIDQLRVDSYGTFAASPCFTLNAGSVLDVPTGFNNVVTVGGAGAKVGGTGTVQGVTMQGYLGLTPIAAPPAPVQGSIIYADSGNGNKVTIKNAGGATTVIGP